MKYFYEILNLPTLQILGIILLIGIAERIGIPVIAFLKFLFKFNGSKLNDNEKDELIKKLNEEIEIQKDNHNHHLEIIISKLDEILKEEAANHAKIITLLEYIHKK